MTGDAGRYAIYFAPPPGSALARFGAEWLGYDAETGTPVAPLSVPGLPAARLDALTAEPRRYGFHATLKPPFALAAGTEFAALDAGVHALACQTARIAAPTLKLSCIAHFWALTLSRACPELDRLSALCVRELDPFRAPSPAAELARRRQAGLSSAQEAWLQRWGYPYVMDEFRFHMTLTGRLQGEERHTVGRVLAGLVEALCRTPLAIDALCLFRQDTSDAPFRVLRRYPLVSGGGV